MIIDLVFSLDSIITAVGMVDDVRIMIAAVVASVALMMLFAGPIGRFVSDHPTIKMLALSFLVVVGVVLVAEGLRPPRAQGLRLLRDGLLAGRGDAQHPEFLRQNDCYGLPSKHCLLSNLMQKTACAVPGKNHSWRGASSSSPKRTCWRIRPGGAVGSRLVLAGALRCKYPITAAHTGAAPDVPLTPCMAAPLALPTHTPTV
jgi:hypothetical protein